MAYGVGVFAQALVVLAETGDEDDRVYAVEAASLFSRPGPRSVDGVKCLAALFHPDCVPSPGSRKDSNVVRVS